MSKRISDERYEKTKSYRLKQWLDGTKDLYLDAVEMREQKPFKEDKKLVEKRKKETQRRFARLYDVEHNAEMRIFRKIYRVFSVLFCVFLVLMLLTAVSHLPVVGNPENPTNNEVAQRYIES